MNNHYNVQPLVGGASHVFLVTANNSEASIAGFFRNRNIDEILAEKGALLFRGFPIKEDQDFSRLVSFLAQEELTYQERSTQRKKTAKGVYTSTEYPAAKTIANHSENAFQSVVPGKILFYAHQAALKGGETPIADNAKVLALIDEYIVDSFRQKGIRYLRNFDGGFDLSWQEAFQTESKAEVESYCKKNVIDYEWLSDSHLRTSQYRSATRKHPLTGKEMWFNQLHLFHITNLELPIRQALLASLGRDLLPRHVVYGTGEEIPDEVVDHIRKVLVQAELVFPWQTGDVLIADNILVSHGRKPFEGERSIRVALIDPVYPSAEENAYANR
ncbi:TauD/TfdA family dioxygenase [Fluviispira multicolorata]|uniref:Taurine catabolism dioxygenase TauD n=1 Tax=Fluviispira multicolorata TaxID=2654512 RepID=A0A833JE48_9BACT|nr:TauD/TfdA family dioxygenase [Fluviispira multicolorata]KAB8029694.1 taurine catabolism dioxygenase TauD [Fluviispira multicolorata]